jgi:hypothetical protein
MTDIYEVMPEIKIISSKNILPTWSMDVCLRLFC